MLSAARQMRRSTVHPSLRTNSSKSLTVKKWDIRRVVPTVREQLGPRRAPAHEVRPPHTPVAEIRECHDGVTPYAQHLPHNLEGAKRLLESLAQDDVIESLVRIARQPLLDISLVDGDTPRDRLLHLGRRRFRGPWRRRLCSRPARRAGTPSPQPRSSTRLLSATRSLIIPRSLRPSSLRKACQAPFRFSIRWVLSRNPLTISVCSPTSARNASCP